MIKTYKKKVLSAALYIIWQLQYDVVEQEEQV